MNSFSISGFVEFSWVIWNTFSEVLEILLFVFNFIMRMFMYVIVCDSVVACDSWCVMAMVPLLQCICCCYAAFCFECRLMLFHCFCIMYVCVICLFEGSHLIVFSCMACLLNDAEYWSCHVVLDPYDNVLIFARWRRCFMERSTWKW